MKITLECECGNIEKVNVREVENKRTYRDEHDTNVHEEAEATFITGDRINVYATEDRFVAITCKNCKNEWQTMF